MKRKHITQINERKWFPQSIRTCIHEFMTWFVGVVKAAKPFMPVIEEALPNVKKIIIIDKESGAGFETIDGYIDQKYDRVHIDSKNFNASENGLYLSVNSFHKFQTKEAKQILTEIYNKNQPIFIVEGNNDSLWQLF